jgi:hypothetical protein
MTGYDLFQRRTTIRLLSDGAESVIWFFGPVPYEQTRLTDELVTALRAWDDSHWASIDLETRRFRSEQLSSSFSAKASDLAERIAGEVGPGFQVECEDVVRSRRPATNPDAEAFFNDLADAEVAKVRRFLERAARSEPRSPTDEPDSWFIANLAEPT